MFELVDAVFGGEQGVEVGGDAGPSCFKFLPFLWACWECTAMYSKVYIIQILDKKPPLGGNAWPGITPPKDFLRQMPNALPAGYFQGRGLFENLDFAAMKEGKPDELFAAWLYLPEEQRNAMVAVNNVGDQLFSSSATGSPA